MALTPKIEIKQSQSLLMTPQLRQAINLLQMSNLELGELVSKELETNPFLEREDERLNDSQPHEQTIDDYDAPQEAPKRTILTMTTASTMISAATVKDTKSDRTLTGGIICLRAKRELMMTLTILNSVSPRKNPSTAILTNRFCSPLPQPGKGLLRPA